MEGLKPVKKINSSPAEQSKVEIEARKTHNYEQSTVIANTVADNFPKILDLAQDYMEIKKMKVQTAAVIQKMEQDRKNLLAEAEVYATKKRIDMENDIKRMEIMRQMMLDFYKVGANNNVSVEDFRMLLSEVMKSYDNKLE